MQEKAKNGIGSWFPGFLIIFRAGSNGNDSQFRDGCGEGEI